MCCSMQVENCFWDGVVLPPDCCSIRGEVLALQALLLLPPDSCSIWVLRVFLGAMLLLPPA
jgi:hypothetical protein